MPFLSCAGSCNIMIIKVGHYFTIIEKSLVLFDCIGTSNTFLCSHFLTQQTYASLPVFIKLLSDHSMTRTSLGP